MSNDFSFVNKKLGENIARLRKERGYSQKKFADIIGFSQSILSAWELGVREMSLETIWKIANSFKVPVSSLLPLASSGIAEEEAQAIAERISSDPQWREVFQIIDFMPAQKREALFAMIKAMKE